MSSTNGRMRACGRTVMCLLALLFLAAPAAAQFDRAQVSGTIKDETGAVVPGATVTATNLQTQNARMTVTDGSGYYTFPNLAPGKLRARGRTAAVPESHARERAARRRGRLVSLDFTLQTGALTESVTVTAEQRRCKPTSALRKTVEAKDIEQIAFSGRNPIGVVGLKAGVVGGSFNNRSFSNLTNGGFNINGSRPNENNITVDGAIAIRTRASGNIIGIQNVDAIQEIQVLTGELHAGVRTRQRRPDPLRHEEWKQPFSGHAAGSSTATNPCRPTPGRRNRSTNPLENSGPAPFDYKQYGYAFGGPVPVGRVEEQVVLLRARRNGSISSRSRPTPRRFPTGRCAPAISASCSTRTTGSSRGRGPSSIRRPARRFPATSFRPTGCRPTAWLC